MTYEKQALVWNTIVLFEGRSTHPCRRATLISAINQLKKNKKHAIAQSARFVVAYHSGRLCWSISLSNRLNQLGFGVEKQQRNESSNWCAPTPSYYDVLTGFATVCGRVGAHSPNTRSNSENGGNTCQINWSGICSPFFFDKSILNRWRNISPCFGGHWTTKLTNARTLKSCQSTTSEKMSVAERRWGSSHSAPSQRKFRIRNYDSCGQTICYSPIGNAVYLPVHKASRSAQSSTRSTNNNHIHPYDIYGLGLIPRKFLQFSPRPATVCHQVCSFWFSPKFI